MIRFTATGGAALAIALALALPAQAADAPVIGTVVVVKRAPTVVEFEAPVDARGSATSVHMEFGRTRSLGGRTGTADLPAQGGSSPVSFTVTRLQPGKTYFYRVVATSAQGTSTTDIASVTTPTVSGPRLLTGAGVQFAISTGSSGRYPWKVLAVLLPHGVPSGTLVSVRCRRACRGGGSARARPGTHRLRFRNGLRITKRSVVEVRETADGYIGRVRRFEFRRSGSLLEAFRVLNRCLQGSPARILACPK